MEIYRLLQYEYLCNVLKRRLDNALTSRKMLSVCPAVYDVYDWVWEDISANENTMGMSHVKKEECSLSESSVLSSII